MNCIKLLLGTVFIIRDLLWQRIFNILCISMILLLMPGISLSTMLLKKSIHMTMTVPMVMIHVGPTANVITELYHDRDTHHYPVNIDSCSEFNDFLKTFCTLSLFIFILCSYELL